MADSLGSPALSDVRQDVSVNIPHDLVQAWVASDRSPATHDKLLLPFVHHGTLVCSDSAGLSRLTRERELVEVMDLVGQPKEVIAAYGRSIGGLPVDIWAADNTTMFYPATTSVDDVVRHMAAAQRVMAALPVQVGLAVHRSSFYRMGDSFVGVAAETVEEIAETWTEGGDLLLTSDTVAALSTAWPLQEHPLGGGLGTVWKVNPIPEVTAVPSPDCTYPYPFDAAFHDLLQIRTTLSAEELSERCRPYTAERCVVLVSVQFPARPLMLDSLVDRARIGSILQAAGPERIKSGGSLGIYTIEQSQEALPFATSLQARLNQEGVVCSIGISYGRVLLFTLADGSREIAGQPVNIASKLAEDADVRGRIYVEDTVPVALSSAEPFSLERSHVPICGHVV